MKRRFLKQLCLLLACLLTFSACNQSGKEPNADTEQQTEPTPTEPVSFLPGESIVIVRGDLYTSNVEIGDACFLLKKAFEAAYGVEPIIESDKKPRDTHSLEILVGTTNRPDSQNEVSQLALNDYAYLVKSQNTVVICGGTPEKTLMAAEKFCKDVLTYNGKKAETKNVKLTTGTAYRHNETYDYSTLTINGVLLEDYTLAVSSPADIPGAVLLMQELGKYTGQTLPIILESEMTGEEESIIRIGAAYRNGKKSTTLSGYTVNNYIDRGGNVLCLEASSNTYYERAVADLMKKYEKEIDGMSVSRTLDQKFFYHTNTENKDGSNKSTETVVWDLTEQKTEELGEGLTYVEEIFYDDRGLPHRVFTLIVDSNLYDFTMGSSRDSLDFSYTNEAYKQTVEQHMQAAIANGKNAVAGINGDQFYIDGWYYGDYRPLGLTIKNGVLISKGEESRPALGGTTEKDRAFFGITKDGKPIIAMESEYINDDTKLDTLQTAIGANIKLAENGKTVYYKTHKNIGHGQASYDPRTVYGYSFDGKVILMCVDGRSVNYSNGAWLLQLSLLAHRFGASDLVQLDGGGSTCMVLRDPDTNVYTTVNKPSDGQLRRVYNSLLVIKK